jgi:hypothetical protein
MGPTGEEISYREHFEELLKAAAKLEDERWIAHEKIHAVAQKADDATIEAIHIRLEQLNELRRQTIEDRADFVRRDIYTAAHEALKAKMDNDVDKVNQRISLMENFRSNLEGRFWMLGAALLAVNAILTLILKFWVK